MTDLKDIAPIVGKIVQVNLEKGFFFITSEEQKFVRFFAHWSSIKSTSKVEFKDLKRGMKVRFVPSKNEERGYRANYIEVLTAPDESHVS